MNKKNKKTLSLQERSYRNGKYAFTLAMERAKKYNAFPKWADTPANRNKILQIYILAQYKNLTTKRKWQVDHIIPLYGYKVCGLHVPDNLRVISKVANEAKSNNFVPYKERNGRRTRLEQVAPRPKYKRAAKRSTQKMNKKVIFRKRNFFK